jgi:Leucine-rich repeat (LRR) protein
MDIELGKPSPAYLRELKEVAEAASALSLHLVKANILPRDFPVEPVSTLCTALMLLPHGTSEGSVPVLIHARERVPALRREYVLSEPEEGEKREHRDIPPVFRGEELDRRLNELYAAVGTALDHYKAETRTEIEPDAERDASVLARPEFGLDKTVKEIREAEAEIDGFKKSLPENSAGQRGLSDIDSQLKAGRSEASMPSPKPALLTRIGKALRQTPEALERFGYWMSAADDLSEPLIDAGFEILRKKVSGFFGRISKVGTALQETANRMKKWRDSAPGGNGSPPPDFDMDEVHAMILRGERPKASWRPFIKLLNFGDNEKFGDLSPVSVLSALEHLSLDNTQVSDLSPVSGLSALTWLSLNNTQVSDLSPVSGLSALTWLSVDNTQVSDLSSVSHLSALTELWLNNTQVSDLSPLSGLNALTGLLLSNTQVSDLSPVSGLSALERLSLDNTQVSDLSPVSGLSALTELSLDNTQVSDLSPVSGLSALTWLSLNNTQVSNLSPVSGLSALTGFWLNNTQVSDLSPVSGLSVLTWLALDNTQVSDLSPLSGLSGLTELWLNNTQVSDVGPLAGLNGLGVLSLALTFVTDLSPLAGLTGLEKLYLGISMDKSVSVLDHLEHLTIIGGPAPRDGKPRPE